MADTKTIVLTLAALLTTVSAAAAPVDLPAYVDFATFKALTALVPEVPQPRLLTGRARTGSSVSPQEEVSSLRPVRPEEACARQTLPP